MVTNKIDYSGGDAHCVYAGFLTGKGRLLCDALFYHRPLLRSFFVEVDTQHTTDIVNHLKKFKLRSTVFLDEETKNAYNIWSILAIDLNLRDKVIRNILNRDTFGNVMSFYVDPRWPLSIRVILPKDLEPPLRSMDLFWSTDGNQELYDYFRMVHGVPEGQKEMPYEKQVPLEANMQDFGGIDFDKGCYLGQELIARTYHRGELHKRLFTLRLLQPYANNHQVINIDNNLLIHPTLYDGIASIGDNSHKLVGNSIQEQSGKKNRYSSRRTLQRRHGSSAFGTFK